MYNMSLCTPVTVLKMIAKLLPEDKNRVIGGSVQVNGVDSKDKDIVWSVSLPTHFTFH